jgi:predicted Zn-ribbon and HTH transcriptional regulator
LKTSELREKIKSRKTSHERKSELLSLISDVEFRTLYPGDEFPPEAFGPRRIPDANAASTIAWAEANVVFSSRIPTSKPGPWRASTVPAICAKGGPLDALNDTGVEKVIVMKGSQTALTTTAYVWLAHALATEPASALIVMNSGVDAKHKCLESWKPMWEDSPGLQRYIPGNIREDWTKSYQLLNSVPVYWTGANSAGALGSKPIRYLILDEVDKYPQAFGRGKQRTKSTSASEAGAAALAEQRTKTYRKSGRAKIVKFSTPTDDQGEIAQGYELGDKRLLHVACPYCKSDQVMRWKSFRINLKLAARDARRAVEESAYECPHCKHQWTEHDRIKAITAGEWRPSTQSKEPKTVSYWIPSWLSPFVTVEYLAAKWVTAQSSRMLLQDFINSECGEPFIHFENIIKSSVFKDLEGQYQEGQLFAAVDPYREQYDGTESIVFGGVDVQKGYLVATFRQYVRGGDSGLVWHGTVSDLETLDKLATDYQAQFVLIDMRYRSREVQEWCHLHAGYIPCEGVKTRARSIYAVNLLDLDEGRSSRTGVRVIETLSHDGDQLKDLLAGLLQETAGRRWMVPEDYARNREYCDQMTAERCINGRWVNPQEKPNHAWDSELLCLLAAIRFGFYPVHNEAQSEGGE